MRTNALKISIFLLLMALFLAVLGRTGRCQDPPRPDPAVESPPSVSLPAAAAAKVKDLDVNAAFIGERIATAKETLAKLESQAQNIRLQYLLIISEAKAQLKLSDDYEWTERTDSDGNPVREFKLKALTREAKAKLPDPPGPPAPNP